MSKVMRIAADVFERLQQHAEPLVDTPSDVIRRLLDHYEGGKNAEPGENDGGQQAVAGGKLDLAEEGHTMRMIERSRNGSLTGAFLRKLLLAVLFREGGRAETMHVLKKMRALLQDWSALHQIDLDISSEQNCWPRWETNARFERKHLVDDGLLKSTLDSDRGWWELTDKGRLLAIQSRLELSI